MEQYQNNNRRRSPRVEVSIPVLYWGKGVGSQYWTTDISVSGIRMITNQPFKELARFELAILLPDGLEDITITCQAMVVRSERLGSQVGKFAVAFFITEMSDDDKSLLEEFVMNEIAEQSALATNT